MILRGKQLDAINAAIKNGGDVEAAFQKTCEANDVELLQRKVGLLEQSAIVDAKDRKGKIEQSLVQARKLCTDCNETQQAWLRLCRELDFMCDPEAKPPRFSELLHAIWIASTGDQT